MKKNLILKRTFFVICVSFLVISGCKEEQVKAEGLNDVSFEKTELTIISNSEEHYFNVEVADTPDKRSQGLMFRRKMASDEGMIFDFEVPMTIRMWMKNTYIPLDMLFISADNKILDIIENTVPLSENVLSPKGEVKYVLEINAGIVKRLGIKAGNAVDCKVFD